MRGDKKHLSMQMEHLSDHSKYTIRKHARAEARMRRGMMQQDVEQVRAYVADIDTRQQREERQQRQRYELMEVVLDELRQEKHLSALTGRHLMNLSRCLSSLPVPLKVKMSFQFNYGGRNLPTTGSRGSSLSPPSPSHTSARTATNPISFLHRELTRLAIEKVRRPVECG